MDAAKMLTENKNCFYLAFTKPAKLFSIKLSFL